MTKKIVNNKRLETVANNYLKPNSTFSVDARLISIMADVVKDLIKGPNVLEMGVGANEYTAIIIKKFDHSYIVDFSHKLLNQAQKRYGDNITTFFSSFENFKPDILFDTVLATNVLEHVENPIQVLKKIKTWIKKDGKVLINVPNANSLHRIYGVCLGLLKKNTDLSQADKQIGHKRVYIMEKLEKDIQKAGLRVVSKRPTFIKLFSNSQMKDFSDSQLIGLYKLAKFLPLEFNSTLFYVCSI